MLCYTKYILTWNQFLFKHILATLLFYLADKTVAPETGKTTRIIGENFC